ncbi:MAG: bifunctional diaminohydroxyphosphoribosylaminopyrimidine deaminase/5-amino-6-(5-phosphoribosylamino)uracil reductase RibD [Gammaproteobacteria bacterium]
MTSRQDNAFMARAIQLAKRGMYTCKPNPRVGCVLVKDGKVLAEGWHRYAGHGHAEVEALAKSSDARGATAYVTLEPCSHYGKTPPCSQALINAGIARVVAAMQDPNPLVAGQGLQQLRDAGIDVQWGVLETQAAGLNPGFIKRMQSGVPFVTSKLAMSLDGRTAMASGESKWITSTAARADVQRLRAASCALLTGINTVLADDPSLNARLSDDVVQPLRVILDSKLQMPVQAKMAGLPGRSLILTCCGDAQKTQALRDVGFQVQRLAADAEGRVALDETMRFLGTLQINEVLVEAGPTLNGALLSGGYLDQCVVYLAPLLMGDAGRGLFSLPGVHSMANAVKLRIDEVRCVGKDLRITFAHER